MQSDMFGDSEPRVTKAPGWEPVAIPSADGLTPQAFVEVLVEVVARNRKLTDALEAHAYESEWPDEWHEFDELDSRLHLTLGRVQAHSADPDHFPGLLGEIRDIVDRLSELRTTMLEALSPELCKKVHLSSLRRKADRHEILHVAQAMALDEASDHRTDDGWVSALAVSHTATEPIDWEEATRGDVPTDEMLTYWMEKPDARLGETLTSLIYVLESGYYLTWEAVIRAEQDLELSACHAEAIASLCGGDGRTLYVDGLGRPEAPWYVVARRLAEALVREETFRPGETVTHLETECWPELRSAIAEYTHELDWPSGVADPLEVIDDGTREHLDLQCAAHFLADVGSYDLDGAEHVEIAVHHTVAALHEARGFLTRRNTPARRLLERVELPTRYADQITAALFAELDLEDEGAPLFGA